MSSISWHWKKEKEGELMFLLSVNHFVEVNITFCYGFSKKN